MAVSRRTLHAVILAGLLAIAGCTTVADDGTNSTSTTIAPSSPSPHESYFVFKNEWNAPPATAENFTYNVTLYVTNAPVTEYTVTYSDGRTKTYEGDVPPSAIANATRVAPTEVLLTKTYEVGPESTLYVALQNTSETTTLIYNYHSEQNSGVALASGSDGAHGPWFIRLAPRESHTSIGGEYRDELGKNTTYHTIPLNRSQYTTR